MGSCSGEKLKLNERHKSKFNADDAIKKGTMTTVDLSLTNDILSIIPPLSK
jgi:hypothetical protein